ncbi:hypothetical protein JOQ06_024741, partial [Pogonophryne albipinna]
MVVLLEGSPISTEEHWSSVGVIIAFLVTSLTKALLPRCSVRTFYTQVLNEEERQRLCQNMAGALKGAQRQALSFKHHTDKMISKLTLLVIMMLTGNCMLWKAYIAQSTCACKECSPSKDLWYNKRFNKSVQPFLSANMNFSEEAFKWWKRLQNEQGTFDLFKKTVHDLFGMFPKPDVKEYHPDRCRTCAVVGNSGNLLRSRYGPVIDFYDVVI